MATRTKVINAVDSTVSVTQIRLQTHYGKNHDKAGQPCMSSTDKAMTIAYVVLSNGFKGTAFCVAPKTG